MKPFTPPTAEQVNAHLQRFSVRGPSRVMAWATLVAFPVIIFLSFSADSLALLMLPMVLVIALIVGANVRVKRLRELERLTLQVQELSMLGRHREALRAGWELLPRLTQLPPLHGRVVASIAHNLDQLRSFDAAIAGYDYLIAHLPPEDPIAVQFQVLRSIAQLATDRLTDADDTLLRLRGIMGKFKHHAVAAGYRLATLVQQIRTNHYAQAIEDSDDLLDDLRPLGVQAGFGHAMMALAHHQLAMHKQQQPPRETELWWSRATLLLSPAKLVERYPELQPLTGDAHG